MRSQSNGQPINGAAFLPAVSPAFSQTIQGVRDLRLKVPLSLPRNTIIEVLITATI